MPVKILSIDGGGIRGIIPGLVLHRIEEKTGKPVAELFDVIAGTSTGGILALGLTCPEPRHSAADLVGLYEDKGADIFPADFFTRVRQAFDEKYPAAGLERALADALGDARLKDARTAVLITSYDIGRRQPVFFRSARAAESPETHDFLMRDVARATSAAPTYFEPLRLPAPDPHPDYTLVDGGVFANNPGMCAFVDDYTVDARAQDTLMVSLGTGALGRPIAYEDAKDWGVIGWARPILDVVFDGVSDVTDYQLSKLLGERYHRLQVKLEKARDELDCATPRNIENLKLEAEELIATNEAELDEICAKLAA